MKTIPLSSLVPGTFFDQPVFLDGDYILLTPDSPVTAELVKRLQKWRYLEVATDGAARTTPRSLSRATSASSAPQTFDEGIQENEQVKAARGFHATFTAFTEGLFSKFTQDNVLNLAQVTESIKTAIQMVHENRDFLLRFLDVGADADRYLITHAVNSTILALAIGDYMKAPPHRLIELGQACLLHEIGMLKLPGGPAAPPLGH